MPIKITARVIEVGEVQQLRRTQKPDIFKRIVELHLIDTEEVIFGEVRNSGIKILDREGVTEGSIVEVEITFEGAIRIATNNKFNNLLISKIKVIE